MIDYTPTISQIEAVLEKATTATILTNDECYIYNRYVLLMSEDEAARIAYGLFEDIVIQN